MAKQTREKTVLRKTLLDHTTPETTPWHMRKRLNFAEIEQAYLRDALIFRGINKKSRDLFKKWHSFEPVGNAAEPDPVVVEKLEAFARRVGLQRIVTLAAADVYLYGDAYVEKVWAQDVNTADEDAPSRKGDLTLEIVNPATMRPVRDTEPGSPTLGQTLYFEQRVPGGVQQAAPADAPVPQTVSASIPLSAGPATRYHPDRIEKLQFYNIGDDWRGVSAIEAAYNVVISKFKADLSLGDVLFWDSKGFQVLTIEDGTEEDIREGLKLIKSARDKGLNYFVGTDRHTFDIKSPTQLNPDPILTSFYVNLAAALDMPKDMLIGASAGAVTGSETNLRDYYEDTAAMLDCYMTEFVERIYAEFLGVKREELPVRIVWNLLYVNEQAAADTAFKSAQAASVAWRDGVLTLNEYRGKLGLDPMPGGDELANPNPAPPAPTPDGGPAPPSSDGAAPTPGDSTSSKSNNSATWKDYFRAPFDALRRP